MKASAKYFKRGHNALHPGIGLFYLMLPRNRASARLSTINFTAELTEALGTKCFATNSPDVFVGLLLLQFRFCETLLVMVVTRQRLALSKGTPEMCRLAKINMVFVDLLVPNGRQAINSNHIDSIVNMRVAPIISFIRNAYIVLRPVKHQHSTEADVLVTQCFICYSQGRSPMDSSHKTSVMRKAHHDVMPWRHHDSHVLPDRTNIPNCIICQHLNPPSSQNKTKTHHWINVTWIQSANIWAVIY